MHKRWKWCPMPYLPETFYQWVWLTRNVWLHHSALRFQIMPLWKAAIKALAKARATIV